VQAEAQVEVALDILALLEVQELLIQVAVVAEAV
jgi:hypothetical protein